MRFQAVILALALGACGAAPGARVASAHDASRSKQVLPPPWTSGMATQASVPAPTPDPTPEPTAAGRRVVQTAERMVDEGTVVRGSCYRYIDSVFDTAGYRGWGERTTVFRGHREGPYANLDDIQPGDWLWIVNHPELTPVGTHSVLFLGWEDRESGYARVVSYVGGAADRPGDVVGYDVSRTYRIMRAVEPD